jgi:hypothetical protein
VIDQAAYCAKLHETGKPHLRLLELGWCCALFEPCEGYCGWAMVIYGGPCETPQEAFDECVEPGFELP